MQKVATYLGSTKNIAGCVMFGVGVALFALGVTGAYGLWIAGIMYIVTALLTPHPKANLVIMGGSDTEEISTLRKDLAALQAKVASLSGRIPSPAKMAFDRVVENLQVVLERSGTLAPTSEEMLIVSRTIRDYLPTSLEGYLNLPSSYVITHAGSRRTALDELCSQLAILERESAKAAEAVYRGDAEALTNQGRFLADRFHSSELDIKS